MRNEMIKWIKNIVFITAIIIIFQKYVFGFTIVQGTSMNPTIHDQDKLFVNKIIYLMQKPKPGDIVIFHPPIEGRRKELLIKRVIAVEGDSFSIREGKLFINDMEVKEPYTLSEQYIDRNYQVTSGIVPQGMVFVMGDNRNDSNDSRCFGFVSIQDIKGKADLKIWPLKKEKTVPIEYAVREYMEDK